MGADLVIVLSDPALAHVAEAGVRRAGCGATVRTVPAEDTEALRGAPGGGHDVVLALCEATSMGAVLGNFVRMGRRPIPVLRLIGDGAGLSLSTSTRSWLVDPHLRDLEIPVPSMPDDATRKILWDQLRETRAQERHHMVEVDGRPAIEPAEPETGADAGAPARLAAGAAGVLAGRLAASDRRWRAQLDV